MMKRVAAWVAVITVSGLVGCDRPSPGSSVATASQETTLFKSLPRGATVVFGGNYLRMQKFMSDSALGKHVGETMDKGAKAWSDCFLGIKNVQLAGSGTVAGGTSDIRMVMSGLTIGDITTCATQAGYQATTDADGTYISVLIKNEAMSINQGYLKLGTGALYFHQVLDLAHPIVRADLETDVASLAKGSVLDDPALAALAAKADRSKTLWFAGRGAGTPVADKLGDVFGTLDFEHGVAIDVTAQLASADLATQVEATLGKAKAQAAALPADIRDVVTGAKLTRKGNELHVVVAATEAQVAGVISGAGGMFAK